MIKERVKDLPKIEKSILNLNVKDGISTTGKGESIYINALERHHPEKIREAINNLVEKGYFTKPDSLSVFLTDDGIHECRNGFRTLILFTKYKGYLLITGKYFLKNLVVPILVTILTTLLLHYFFGNPFQSQSSKMEEEAVRENEMKK